MRILLSTGCTDSRALVSTSVARARKTEPAVAVLPSTPFKLTPSTRFLMNSSIPESEIPDFSRMICDKVQHGGRRSGMGRGLQRLLPRKV